MSPTNPLTLAIDINGTWRLTFFWGMLVCLLPLLVVAKDLFGWAVACLWGWVVINALYIVEYPSLQFGVYSKAFETTAGQCFLEVLLLPTAVILFPLDILWVLPAAVVYEVGALFFHGYGFMIAPSFDTAFLALCLPFLLKPRDKYYGVRIALIVFTVFTILFHHGSTALMMLGAYALILGFRDKRLRLLTLVSLPLAVFAAVIHSHGPMLDGMERLTVWSRYLTRWAGWAGSQGDFYAHNWRILWNDLKACTWGNISVGAGAGSFMWFSLLIDDFKPPMFLMMHSDWLQILFELGVMGLFLAGWVYRTALKRVWTNTPLLLGVVGSGIFALTYHPLRFFPSALLVTVIFARALRLED